MMTRIELADHIERQMEESAQMGEPPSFAFEDVADALKLVAILRALRPEGREQVISASGNFPVRLYGTSGPFGTAGFGLLIFVDPKVEEHTIEVRDGVTGRVLGKIINIGASSPQEERQ